MNYDPSDSSGTDDDLLPTQQTRFTRGGHVTGNGRGLVLGSLPYSRVLNDMETQIHQIEQEAYCSILQAFKAQSDAITWEKESLITELRQELRVSDEEHRELLSQVNADDVIQRIREWRKAGGSQAGLLNNAQPFHGMIPSPAVSASYKKQPSPSASKRGATLVPARGKKPTAMLPVAQYSSAGPTGKLVNHSTPSARMSDEPAKATAFDPLIGRKVWTRWPEDNNFYKAVITNYTAAEGQHALVYDINTKDDTWEWVNLKEISPEDISWEGEDPGIAGRVGHGGASHRLKKPLGRGNVLGASRGRGSQKNQARKDFPLSENGVRKKVSDDIEILNTDILIKEVDKIFCSSDPDPMEIENAKKVLKEHEKSLIDAIAKLADASGGESASRTLAGEAVVSFLGCVVQKS